MQNSSQTAQQIDNPYLNKQNTEATPKPNTEKAIAILKRRDSHGKPLSFKNI